MADVLVALGGPAALVEAAAHSTEALAGSRSLLGEKHAGTLKALRVRGRVLAAHGDLAGAADACRASLDGLRITNTVEARRSARELAAVLSAQGGGAAGGTKVAY